MRGGARALPQQAGEAGGLRGWGPGLLKAGPGAPVSEWEGLAAAGSRGRPRGGSTGAPGRDAGPGRRPRRTPCSKAPSASVHRALPRPCRGPRVGGTGASTAGQPGTGQASREAAALPGPCALSRGLPDPVPHFLYPGHGSVICSQLPLSVVPLGWLLMCPTGKNLRPWGPPPRHRGK